MSATRTVLVLGANGRLGHAAVLAFAAAGWRVLAQARRTPAELPHGAIHVAAALDDTDALAAAAAGAHAVVYAVNPLYTEWARQMMPLARQGMAVAERLGALFMLPGNVYAFGAGMPATLREETPEHPSTEKGWQRSELEAELRARAKRGTLRSVVIRAGDFYGGGRGSWFDLVIVKALAQGKLVYPGPLDVPHAWAYLPDLARAFVAVAARTAAPVFDSLHFAGHTFTGGQLLHAVEVAADDLGWRPGAGWRRGGVPWGLLRAAGLFVPMLRELARMSYLWRVPHALDGAALRRVVGPLPTTPPREAMRAALTELGIGSRYHVATAARSRGAAS